MHALPFLPSVFVCRVPGGQRPSEGGLPAQVFLTREFLAIAMEFAAGGDMFQYVKHRGGLEEVEARWFFQQLIIGMDYCHKMARRPPAALHAACMHARAAGVKRHF
jgi:serine/threonine protein kinase